MSIEALIQAHTEALLANTEAVKLLTLSLAGRTPKAEDKPKAKSEPMVHDVKKLEEEHKPAKKEEPKDETVVNIEEGIDATVAVPYETVRALVLKLAPTQRDAIKALNAKHGIANLKVLLDKEDDFSTVNDQAKLEAVYADLQALEA
jgi:hypothetical protein